MGHHGCSGSLLAGVFLSNLDGRRLSFRRKGGQIVDKETGSVWNVLGMATEGPLAGKWLSPLEHGTYFAFAWLVFRPDTQIVGEPPIGVDDDRFGAGSPNR